MKLVLDTNILISALIKDSTTRHLIIAIPATLFYPEQALDELIRNKQDIMTKAGMSEDVFKTIMTTLFKYIRLVKKEETDTCMEKARSIMDVRDPKDAIFVAAALFHHATIWSHDKDLHSQPKISVMKTTDILSNWNLLVK